MTSNLRLARRAINDAGKENQEWVGQFMKQLLNIEIMSESYQQNCLYLAIKNKYSNACKTDIEKATHYMIWLYELMGCPVDEAKKKHFKSMQEKCFPL